MNRFNCLKFSSVLCFLLILQAAAAQPKTGKNTKEYGIDRYPDLDAAVSPRAKAPVPNAVALLLTDTIVFKKEMGEFDSKTEAPLGSASKWLTTALIMILVDEGKLSLDDKISQYLPIYGKYGKNYITIRHCLSNFTGIESKDKITDNSKEESLLKEAESFAKKEIQTNPGTEFRYSGYGFTIAGSIAEVVTKKRFDQLIKNRLLNPLGMSRTTFGTLDGSSVDPSEGARTNANDFMKFLQMLLQNGQYNGKQIISEASMKELRRIHASMDNIKFAPKAANNFNYALGSWAIESNNGEATALTDPSWFGTFPVVDWCRGYAYLYITKTPGSEQKPEALLQMKEAIDASRPTKCR